MSHEHSVYDSDTHFVIDPASRSIENTTGKVTLMQGDHNSERMTFELPRHIDGHDMSLCDSVKIHYINTKADKTLSHADAYTVTDLQVSPASEDVVIFSWLVSRGATMYDGALAFRVTLACLADDGTVEYSWNTAKHTGIYIGEGIDNAEQIEKQYSDILSQWEARLDALENGGTGGGITEETDPTVPEWAKQAEKPTYTAEEVGALPDALSETIVRVHTQKDIPSHWSDPTTYEKNMMLLLDDNTVYIRFPWQEDIFGDYEAGTRMHTTLSAYSKSETDAAITAAITAYDTEAMALLGEDGDGE